MEKDRLIEFISKRSDRYGNELIKFMEKYKISCLKDATEEQLEEYIKTMS